MRLFAYFEYHGTDYAADMAKMAADPKTQEWWTDIYSYYDLDWIVTVPNMDPHIRAFETLEETADHVTVRTGFEAVIRKNFADPMPAFLAFDTDTIEKMRAFRFDDPWDERRYFVAGDNQIAGVGDGFARNSPPWVDTVRSLHSWIPVYGSVCEAQEMLWRIVGLQNVMLWIGLYPDEVERFVERLGEFALEITKAQIKAAGGLLDGMVVWGDVAYRKDLFFSPDCWRKYYKLVIKAIVDGCHTSGLPVIYHGCGNVRPIFGDFIDCGVDAYNPLEAKAGLDVVELRRVVLTKLNATKGGGFIFQSDHSVPGDISAQNYEYVINMVREHGRYPLRLGEFDLPDVG
jgi:uroporphyrinogen decarboxylase